MKHQLSDAQIAYRTRPFAHTGRFWGVATVACVVAPYGFWKLLPLSDGQMAVWVAYLLAVMCIGLLVVLVRRVLRPSKSVLTSTVVNVTSTGVWQETASSRTLLVHGAQLRTVFLLRNARNELGTVIMEGGGKEVALSGLADMEGFLTDLRSTFRRVAVVERAAAWAAEPMHHRGMTPDVDS